MNWPERTRHFIFFTAILVMAYDALAIYYGGKTASISWVSRALCEDHLILAVFIGVIIGHIFWNE